MDRRVDPFANDTVHISRLGIRKRTRSDMKQIQYCAKLFAHAKRKAVTYRQLQN